MALHRISRQSRDLPMRQPQYKDGGHDRRLEIITAIRCNVLQVEIDEKAEQRVLCLLDRPREPSIAIGAISLPSL
jgi:hypothetical protein